MPTTSRCTTDIRVKRLMRYLAANGFPQIEQWAGREPMAAFDSLKSIIELYDRMDVELTIGGRK